MGIFDLKGNPFSTSPLQFDDEFQGLFIQTEDIKKKLDEHKKSFEILMESLNGFMIIESSYDIHSSAYKLMKKFCLSSYDAIHIAAMKYMGESNFVSFDKDFEQCVDISLWKNFK